MQSERSRLKLLLHLWPFLVLPVPYLMGSAGVQDFISFALVYGLFAMSLNLLVGYTGLVSFGHAMFFAFGAYGFCLGLQGGLSAVPALLAAVGGTALFAALVGSICVRLRETHFSFITMACSMLVYSMIEIWTPLTGGDQGLTGMIRSAAFLGSRIGEGTPRYYFIGMTFCLAALAMQWIVSSSFGATLRMIRDNEARAAYIGTHVYLTKLAAFTLAASFAAVAGVLATLLVSGAYPTMALWTTSGDAIFAILLGGSRVFYGPLAGATLLRVLIDVTARYTGNTSLVLGLLILAIVLVLKKGPIDLLNERLKARAVRRGAQAIARPAASATPPAKAAAC